MPRGGDNHSLDPPPPSPSLIPSLGSGVWIFVEANLSHQVLKESSSWLLRARHNEWKRTRGKDINWQRLSHRGAGLIGVISLHLILSHYRHVSSAPARSVNTNCLRAHGCYATPRSCVQPLSKYPKYLFYVRKTFWDRIYCVASDIIATSFGSYPTRSNLQRESSQKYLIQWIGSVLVVSSDGFNTFDALAGSSITE